jgi:hypothetical protein
MAKLSPAIVLVVRLIDVISSGPHAIDACAPDPSISHRSSVCNRADNEGNKTTSSFKSHNEALIFCHRQLRQVRSAHNMFGRERYVSPKP